MWVKSSPKGMTLMTCSSLGQGACRCGSLSPCFFFFRKMLTKRPLARFCPKVLLLQHRRRPKVLCLDRDVQETRRHVYDDAVGLIRSNVGVVAQRKEEVVESIERQRPKFTSRNSTPWVWRRWVLCSMSSGSTRVDDSGKVGTLLALARRRRVSGRHVEVMIGHTTVCGLVRRVTLSVFGVCRVCLSGRLAKHSRPNSLPWLLNSELLGSHGVPHIQHSSARSSFFMFFLQCLMCKFLLIKINSALRVEYNRSSIL